ncbi:MAG: hypothetical protein ACREL5_08240 [Gemmatimonadales bacterium]
MNDALAVRVRVLEAWEDFDVSVDPATSIGDLKRQVLGRVRIPADPSRFMVKFRGAEITDETRSLEEQQVPPGAALIVLRRHRMPVR